MAHTVRLAELREGDRAAFGGKSATLGELLAAGIPVPRGFAVSTSAYRDFVESEGLRATIDAELAGVMLDDVGTIEQAATAIGAAIRSSPVGEALRGEIADRLAELGLQAVAVRSSALGEDSSEATYAGQQDTFLWVRGAEAVWWSVWSGRRVSARAASATSSSSAHAGAVSPCMRLKVRRTAGRSRSYPCCR